MEPWLAYFHYLTIFVTFALLLGEFLLLRIDPSPQSLRLLARLDIGYALFAGLVMASGLLRVFFGEIPAGHWPGNVLFWVKMGLFGTVGLLSIPPTKTFLSWTKALESGTLPDPAARKKVGLFVHLELTVMILIPLLAVFMGR